MKKLVSIIALGLAMVSCSKKEVTPKTQVTYKVYSSTTPYKFVYWGMDRNEVSVNSKSYEITVDYDKDFNNNQSIVYATAKGDTLRLEVLSEGKTAKREVVATFAGATCGLNYNSLK